MQHVPFTIVRDELNGSLVVAGDIEEADIEALRRAISEAGEDIVSVDLSAVTYLPSYVLGALASAAREAAVPGAPAFEIVVAQGSIAASVLKVVAIPHRVVLPPGDTVTS